MKQLLNKGLMRQVFLYGIIGGGSALSDFLLFTLQYSRFGMNKYLANLISVHVAMIISFTFNCKFNFKKTDRILFRAVAFYLTCLLGLSVSQGLLWLGSVMGLSVVLVKLFSIFVVAAVQFTINKLVTFNN